MRASIGRSNARLLTTLLLCSAIALPTAAAAGTYINIDVPGAVYTIAYSVNNSAEVTGTWYDGSTVHGFLRQVDGTITDITVARGIETGALSINGSGQIVGYYLDSNYAYHGFLRNLAGEFTTLNEPNAGWKKNQGTFPWAINNAGEIVGYYYDIDGANHGFVRDALGNYTSFDLPSSIGLWQNYINQSGEVAGTYATGDYIFHGYVRNVSGNLTTFDATSVPYYTFVYGISTSGQIVGSYYDTAQAPHGYLRNVDGTITSFDVQVPGNYPYPVGIQDNGDVIGQYQPSNLQVYRGFRRTQAGVVTSFRDPNAGFWDAGTYPRAVSGKGYISGSYIDSAGAQHGFVWKP
jgi:uncharacterized membrane protein